MPHTNTYDITTPLNTELASDGATHIRNAKKDFKERFELDHNMDGVLDPALVTADGYHKKVTLKNLTADPEFLTDGGILYSKIDGGLYYRTHRWIVRII